MRAVLGANCSKRLGARRWIGRNRLRVVGLLPAVLLCSSAWTAPRTVAFSITPALTMPTGVKKEHLPVKTCVICNRPFTWRKKWEKCWDEVTTCSKSCNRKRRTMNQQANQIKNRLVDNNHCHDDTEDGTAMVKYEVYNQERQVEKPSDDQNDPVAIESLLETEDMSKESLDILQEELTTLSLEDQVGWDDSRDSDDDAPLDPKAARKAAKKRAKAERRAKREGRADPSHGQKSCDLCHKSVDLLIRCTVDASGDWKMVCGKCWNKVSGGVVDGDAQHPHYRYGGLWKNRAKRS